MTVSPRLLVHLLAIGIGAVCYAAPMEPLVVSARVEHIVNHDFAGIQTFQLHLGGEHGTVTVLGDGDLPLIKELLSRDKQCVSIEVRGQ